MTNHNPWFEATLLDTVVRQRAANGTDTYGNVVLDWSSPDVVTWPVMTEPPTIKSRLGSHAADEDMSGRDAVRFDLSAYLAVDDFTPLDRAVYQGKTYEVMGQPANRKDLDGNYVYSKVLLREVSG